MPAAPPAAPDPGPPPPTLPEPAPRADVTVAPKAEPPTRPDEPIRPPAASAAPAAPVAAAAASSGSGTLEQLLAAWPAIVERLSSHPPTRPLIVACRPVAVDGAVVTLGFPEEQAFLKDQAERRKPGIEAGIAEVVGHPVTVHCVVANVELPPAASDDLVAEARRIFAEELADVGEVS